MKTINKKAGAWVCTNENDRQTRGRTKVYQPGSKIYLNDNEEFEIELFNPTSHNVKAEIKIDGKSISSGGLVIRSGQRVYLECFPDSQKKFTFKTYEIENSQEAIEATSENGRVDIKFYREKINYPNYGMTYPVLRSGYGNNFNRATYDTGISGLSYTNISNTTFHTNSLSNSEVTLDSLETGQVDGGNLSDQEFTTIDMDFESWVLSSYNFQLLPMSHKTVEEKEFKTSKSNKSMNDKLDQLERLHELNKSGVLNEKEYEQMKAEIMS